MKRLLPIRYELLENGKYLISNVMGGFLIISHNMFREIRKKKLEQDTSPDYVLKFADKQFYNDLIKSNFIVDNDDLSSCCSLYRQRNVGLFHDVNLHIFVLTLKCNLNCVYCQASYEGNEQTFMTKEIARKAVDFAVHSSERNLTFEFQGGEPLLNFNTLKFIVEYTENLRLNKNISYTLVNNGQAMDDEKLDFLIEHDVSICFSIDGPQKVHDANRPSKCGISSFDNVVYWYKRAKMKYAKVGKNKVTALPTTTRVSLAYAKEIVEFYRDIGENYLSVRPLSPFGRAGKNWDKLCYTADEFLDYYKECMFWMEHVNRVDKLCMKESFSEIIESKLNGKSINYPDLRNPCGAGKVQIAYNWDGKVFTCDEGRMLANIGNYCFQIGTIYDDYLDVTNSQTLKKICLASCLELKKACNDCAYSPWCGICPVYNLQVNGSMNCVLKDDYRCKILKGIMQFLIEKKI